MNKSLIIKGLINEGFVTDLTLQEDCLYCADTESLYFLKSFEVIKEINFNENGLEMVVKAVYSLEYNLKGFYIDKQ